MALNGRHGYHLQFVGCLLVLSFSEGWAADPSPNPQLHEAFLGWLQLFDRESTWGWDISIRPEIRDGVMVVRAVDETVTLRSRSRFGPAELRCHYRLEGKGEVQLEWQGRHQLKISERMPTTVKIPSEITQAAPVVLVVPPGLTLYLHDLSIRPEYSETIFDGRSLQNWKRYTGDPRREKSEFTISPQGWLHVQGGPGDLQTNEQYADFILHVECQINGDALNSGIFFRALPGQYQQGYEAQIHNRCLANDRTRPADFGTGGIYRRKPARKVVPNDREWFVLTVYACGNQIMTWVNGYPTCEFLDERPPHDNPRSGRKVGAGVISIQGHDPTTDLYFRNIRLCRLTGTAP
jgi:hypothetical protein